MCYQSIIATRNPILRLRALVLPHTMRAAERQELAGSDHEPPRSTVDRSSEPLSHALPSAGAPRESPCQRSRHHSQTLPCMSNRPKPFATPRLPAATVVARPASREFTIAGAIALPKQNG